MRVSAVQIDVRTRDVRGNTERAYRAIGEAARRKSHAVLLPEMWNTGFAYPDLPDVAHSSYRPTLQFMRDAARESGVWLLGSIPEPAHPKVFNTMYWISPGGDVRGEYRKVHLFSPTSEDEFFVAGDSADPVETDFGKTGGLICFDIRFPELARRLTLAKASLLFVPAQFPHPRADHWETLIKARAIENQVWIVAANRIGKSGRLEYFGRSMIVDPWGRIVDAEYGETEAVITADIDLTLVDEVRSRLPCKRHPQIYGNLDPHEEGDF